ncbi:unnamed protein product [Lactuca virosa]|uniref:PXA domain-containing protein n=1 Tax=Lactuca virosa TaxID=75947 RepID=A0AAU9NSW4_9ASTR|nr:unnamed protein product [Lactuca virosa]
MEDYKFFLVAAWVLLRVDITDAVELAVSTSEALTIHERVGYAFQQIYWSGLGAWADGVLGREVMLKLFSKERDERLIHHLMASKELHPSLISAHSEYKIMGVLLAAVLRPQEAQCPLVQYITRELLTCLILEHVMSVLMS